MINRQEIDRPTWEEYFLGMAFYISLRSHDAQTQCGCVIVNEDNQVIGTGYNGFPALIDDSDLPNLRPAKYDYMTHSELQACLNCPIRPKNCTAYITGEPCLQCLQYMWQAGIRIIIYTNLNKAHMCSSKDDKQIKFDDLVRKMEAKGLVIKEVKSFSEKWLDKITRKIASKRVSIEENNNE